MLNSIGFVLIITVTTDNFNFFSGYGTTLCCSRLQITINGAVQDNQGGRSGIYQKARGLVNDRSFWNRIDGDDALWYDNIVTNSWLIGASEDLGSDFRGINSVQDTSCPTSDNRFEYTDGNEFFLAPINSVSIQCV